MDCGGSICRPRVTVGDGAVLGARGVMFKDAVSHGVYAGNPAQLIKQRQLYAGGTVMVDLAVVVLTYNEEMHLARALASVAPLPGIFVVDSGSSDRTVAIAREFARRYSLNEFANQAKQFQWALDNAPITADWVMPWTPMKSSQPDLAEEDRREIADA